MSVNNIGGFNVNVPFKNHDVVKEYEFSESSFDIFTKAKYGMDGTVIGTHHADGTVTYSGEAWDNYQNKYLKRDKTNENIPKEEIAKSVFSTDSN